MSGAEAYAKWIAENVLDPNGACVEMTTEMLAAFPHLRRVRGHYHDPFIGKRPHWWLVDEDEGIVDPTAAQFFGPGEYEEWVEGSPEPTGVCMNCGEDAYGGRAACCGACEEDLAEEYG